MSDYGIREGQVVTVEMGFGRVRKVRVEEIEDDIKNDSPGIGGTTVRGTNDGTQIGASVWAYMSQVREARW